MCVSIENKLSRALLWSAYQHHIREILQPMLLIIKKIEASNGPEIMLFSRFRKALPNLLTINFESLSRLNPFVNNAEANDLIEGLNVQALEMANKEVQLKRDDYQEFAKLCMVYLEQDRDTSQGHYMHKARLMAKLLYSIIICLLETENKEMPSGCVTTKQQGSKVRDFVNFVTLVFSPWWFICTSTEDAQ